ncbi:type II toxin-antitoxin system RelE/ParE family toxin [Bosea sp. 685]|uniref:type II toxin-antitoxin system RelE/ParE family toxin n=1 Tax=Bosea sp. 685 TaxID=3080057 RepID=UPI0028935588|nr:type II toxin-antitoxin system RelE/ParE family toxin [Bosea sp. 685]WNJ88140.1 type II toxin-antitoxin system RelE/ParE family toxin [Bosea sp. 685]
MKPYKVILREDAASDLADIYRWIHQASLSPSIAERYVQRIIAFCEKIGTMPHGGRRRDDLVSGLRTFPFEKRAVIAYFIEGEMVLITNVFHSGRDYEALYRGEPETEV